MLGIINTPGPLAARLQLLIQAAQVFDRLNSIVTDHRTELLHHLLDERITVDRLLGLALAVHTTTERGLGRGFLLRLDQLHAQGKRAPVILVERVVKAPLLGGIE